MRFRIELSVCLSQESIPAIELAGGEQYNWKLLSQLSQRKLRLISISSPLMSFRDMYIECKQKAQSWIQRNNECVTIRKFPIPYPRWSDAHFMHFPIAANLSLCRWGFLQRLFFSFLPPNYSNTIQIFRSIEAEVQHNWLKWENKVIFIPFQTPATNINIIIFIDISLMFIICMDECWTLLHKSEYICKY